MKRATLEKMPDEVAAMFDQVSSKYDLTNFVLTFGLIDVWRVATREAIAPRPGMSILDIAAGTGASSATYAKMGADVVASDFSEGMMEAGRKRRPHLNFVQADATDLPFEDNAFDVTTISYGLRNVQDPDKALREMYRVTKPGGKLVVTEFSRPTFTPFRRLYRFYLGEVLPLMSFLVSSDAVAYDYLVESILSWPAQEEFATRIQQAGWRQVEYRNLSNGVVALHRATKPLA
ncbi:demethylmenaquinone methyltransferase [Trueperella pecoris]|uniref:Demethylmenaquinone methyltransferase n=1 Tax=Trueperella pecoris TaxID=2733571 RepID=A0A7M1R3R0_9ACTO|nr:demethylmenaquinone methyltransferase [Trueperella pecoris]QOR48147.1 demethylmenaquinone methyltransferase [Trueperella pecoris]